MRRTDTERQHLEPLFRFLKSYGLGPWEVEVAQDGLRANCAGGCVYLYSACYSVEPHGEEPPEWFLEGVLSLRMGGKEKRTHCIGAGRTPEEAVQDAQSYLSRLCREWGIVRT